MRTLQCLELRGNPLTQLASMGSKFREILNKGGYATLRFIQANSRGTELIFRIKLMFIGNGKEMKTMTTLGFFQCNFQV